MNGLARFLEAEGFRVVNRTYPSTEQPIEVLAEEHLAGWVEEVESQGIGPIHFVSHSLGGIVLRAYLGTHRPRQLGRSVMLAPPNHGSELADWLKGFFPYRWWNGPAGQQLTTAGLPAQLGPVDFPLGVIAGSRSWNPLFSAKLPGPDDGKVTVESTRIEGMCDHIVVPASHTYLMNDARVRALVVQFLRRGYFQPTDGAIPSEE